MKKILPFICTMFISFSAWGVTCDAGYYLPDGADECVICPAGKYSAAGASSCSNVSAGYFCSGGCTTATPTSSSDCLTGNTCGQCQTDSVTGRPAYSTAGAASCSVCPEVTGDLASRLQGYGYYPNVHSQGLNGCIATLSDDDPDATYRINAWYRNGAYGNGYSQTFAPTACAAGKYNTITSARGWVGGTTNSVNCNSNNVDCAKGQVCTNTMAGYYSPEGATTQTACPVGTYSATTGAAVCSNPAIGYYASGCTNGTTCTGQSQCTGTTYCADGVQYSCPTGYTENTTDGKSAVSQCQATCTAGNYMASGAYTQLEYLQSSGTQYIDTGYPVNNNVSFNAKIRRTSNGGNQAIFGYRFTDTPTALGNMRFFFSYADGKYADGKVGLRNGNGVTNSTRTIQLNTDYVVDYSLNDVKVNNEVWVTSAEYYLTSDFGNGYIFYVNTTGHYSSDIALFIGRIYYAKVYDNNVLVRDMIPARRNSDDTLGMLDLVSGTFFTNAGAGTFTAGPDVDVIGGTCSDTSTAGHYAAATTIGYGTPAPQTACALNTYSASGAASCTACPVGTFAPTGSAVCYPHRLHVGDDVVYTRSTKLTTPSLNIDIDNDGVADFFVNMTTTRTRMNKDSEHYFHAQWGNNDYYICDDTTCPQ